MSEYMWSMWDALFIRASFKQHEMLILSSFTLLAVSPACVCVCVLANEVVNIPSLRVPPVTTCRHYSQYHSVPGEGGHQCFHTCKHLIAVLTFLHFLMLT